jgi:hypothetical protein
MQTVLGLVEDHRMRALLVRTVANALSVLMFEDRHDPVVMPFTADAGGLSFDSFPHKAAGVVAADCPFVIGEDAQVDPVQAKWPKGLFKDKVDRFTTNAAPEMAFMKETDGQPGATVVRIEVVQTRFADKRAVSFDHPSVGMLLQGAKPAVCLTLAQRRQAVRDAAIHPDDLG